MKIREIKAKTIISKSNLPDADYTINPYVGCMHSCIYCYARFMRRFTKHNEMWGKFVDVKINAIELIPTNTLKYNDKKIFLSSVTDCYLPLERKYKITRNILKRLIKLQPNIFIQTKSDLILRDIDLLSQFKSCEVGLTITTLNDNLREEIEPFTTSVENRIKALKKLKEANLKTYIFIGPILPFLTDWKEIILRTKEFTDYYMLENLNIKRTVWYNIKKWLETKHPNLLEKYENIYFSKSPISEYWNEIEEEIKKFCERKVNYKIYFHHKKNSENKKKKINQMSLLF